MTIIELPDDQAAALKEKAAAQGLTLQGWLERLAGGQTRPTRRYNLAELMEQCDPEAPLSEEDREWFDAPPMGRET